MKRTKEQAEFERRRTKEGSLKGIGCNTTLKSETRQSVQKTTTRELMLGVTETDALSNRKLSAEVYFV